MYSDQTISVLSGLIGFGDLSQLDIDDSNQNGTAGRFFWSFHSLVTLSNIYATADESVIDSSDNFNQYLLDIKNNAVKSALVSVLDQNRNYDFSKDYNDEILTKSNVLLEVIGKNTCIMMLEMMMSSNRKNDVSRNAKLSFESLKIELEGLRDEKGKINVVGFRSKYRKSIRTAQDAFFNIEPTIRSEKIW